MSKREVNVVLQFTEREREEFWDSVWAIMRSAEERHSLSSCLLDAVRERAGRVKQNRTRTR